MANLGTVPVIAANPTSTTHTLRSTTYVSSMVFGASMLTAGLGSTNNNQVTNQAVVNLPSQITPVQYWS